MRDPVDLLDQLRDLRELEGLEADPEPDKADLILSEIRNIREDIQKIKQFLLTLVSTSGDDKK